MSHGLLQSFSPVLSSPGFHGCPGIGRMANFIRAGAGRAEGIIFFILMEEKGNSFRFLRPAFSRVSAERTRFLLSVEKGIVVS